MNEEYRNDIQGTTDDINEAVPKTDDFAQVAEEIVETQAEPVIEEAEPVIEEAEFVAEQVEPVEEEESPVVEQVADTQQNTQDFSNNNVYSQSYYGNPSYAPPYQQQQGQGQNFGYYGYNNPYGGGAYTPPSQPTQAPKKKGKGLIVFLVILAAFIFVGIVFGAVSFVVRSTLSRNNINERQYTQIIEQREEADENAPVMQMQPAPSDARALTPTQIAAKVKPSVVAVIVYSNNSGGIASEGSGVLWKEDESGKYTYIITCAHVVNGSGYSYTVQTEDGTQYDAELIGADAKTDLGIIRIEATGLSLAEFGDSSLLQVGDPVYAIGNPGGTEFFGSFTDGVVSAIDRSVQSKYTMICIQHTAAINPGNSGGALVNAYGQVIGINSLKIIDTEYEGMGFAIPIKSAQPIINSLSAYGYVPNRPKLGISYTEAINYQQYSMIIKIKGLPSGSLIITEINSDSALANTEAKQYDMIIAVDGKEMTTPNVLLDRIENGAVGDEITLTLCRIDNNYQISEFNVKVKLVEEKKGSEETETTTAPQMIDPFDYFNGMFW